MVKKSKKGSKKPPPEPEKPFTFDINNFQVEKTRPGLLRLLPVIPENFDQVCFKLKILKNFLTGKPKYEMVYYDCRLLEESAPEDDGRDMRVFSLINPDTGMSVIVDPKKTKGKQPFLALDPVTNKEEPIDPHFMVQHDAKTGKNFLLDVRKFENGKLEFKDPATQELITADLTKRVDPLSGKSLEEQTHEEQFVGTISDGEMYVTKSDDTSELIVRDNNGNVVDVESKGYRLEYIEEEDRTVINNPNGEPAITVEGKMHLKPNHPLDTDEDTYNVDMKKKFTITQDPETGENRIVNEKGEVVEPLPNHYYTIEDPSTGKLILVDNTGQPVPNFPEFNIQRDPKTGKKILVDMLDQSIPGTEEMIINEETLVDENLSPRETSQFSDTKRADELTGDIHLLKDPNTGQPIFVDNENQAVPVRKLYEVTDPETGKTLYFDKYGNNIMNVQENCGNEENIVQEREKKVETLEDKKSLKNTNVENLEDKKPLKRRANVENLEDKKPLKRRANVKNLEDKKPLNNANVENLEDKKPLKNAKVEKLEDNKPLKNTNVENLEVKKILKIAGGGFNLSIPNWFNKFDDSDEADEKIEEEKLFDDLVCKEARNIVKQVKKHAPHQFRPVFLRVIREVIELNKDFIKCALEIKLKNERNFATKLLKEKINRQNEFIRDLLIQSHSGNYERDRNVLYTKVSKKQMRENELLLEKLEARLADENKIIIEVIKRNITRDSSKVIKHTNIPCYDNFKAIVFRDFSENLEKEVSIIRNEIYDQIKIEKEYFFEQIEYVEATFVKNDDDCNKIQSNT